MRRLQTDPSPRPRRKRRPRSKPERLGAPVRPASAHPIGNLPHPLTTFVGRREEMRAVGDLLGQSRLVTLIGAAGCGKTRLALEVAAATQNRFGGGVWVVEMAPVTSSEFVVQQIATALSVPEAREQTSMQAVIERLKNTETLLLLDSCDRLLSSCATVCAQLLGATQGLRVLATSRERLDLPGEVVCRIPPMAVETASTSARPAPAEAVQLFIDRAHLVQPDLRATVQITSVIEAICRRLDGLPLAIELAAARVLVMPPDEILSLLDDRFRLLTSSGRTRLPHHQTLQAALDWSYELLEGEERLLFCRLSIFRGGFGLEAVQAVCSGGGLESANVLGLLSRLVEKSLVVSEGMGHRARYRLLETVGQYAADRLEVAGRADALRDRHLEYFASAVARLYPTERGTRNTGWAEQLESEDDNIRAALEWAILRKPDLAVGLAGRLSRFWALRGRLTEGVWWLQRLLAASGAPTTERIDALNGAGWLAFLHGDHALADRWLAESLRIQHELGDWTSEADAYYTLGLVSYFRGDAVAAAHHFQTSLERATQLGDQYSLGGALFSLAMGDYFARDTARARIRVLESAGVRRAIGDEAGLALAEGLLGMLSLDDGDRREARAHLTVALETFGSAGERLFIAFGLEAFARLAADEADHTRALRLAAAAASLRTASQGPALQPWLDRLEPAIESARKALGRRLSQQAWAEGTALSPDQAIAYALGQPWRTDVVPEETPELGLSPRELEIAELVARGLTNKQVAERLFISVRTAEAHLNHIFDKLGLASRTQLAAWWFEHAASEG